MIDTPQLWLPDRLREWREDERLLRGRFGMSRRWMPGYPCCDRTATCQATCCEVSISGADYTCEVGNATPPIYITEHTWELPGSSGSGACGCSWDLYYEADELADLVVPWSQPLALRYTVTYTESAGTYTLTLTIRIYFASVSRVIVFAKDYDENVLCSDGAIALGSKTLDFVSDTQPTAFPEGVGPPDFSSSTATLTFRAPDECGAPEIYDLFFPYCPSGEAPWSFEVNFAGTYKGAAVDETVIAEALHRLYATGCQRRSYGYGPAVCVPGDMIGQCKIGLRCDAAGSLEWYVQASIEQTVACSFATADGTVSEGCDISGTHTVADWTQQAGTEWDLGIDTWTVTITPVRAFGVSDTGAVLTSGSDLAANAAHPPYTWAELDGKSDGDVVGKQVGAIGWAELMTGTTGVAMGGSMADGYAVLSAQPAATPTYLSLHTADPGVDGANEYSGGNYARQRVYWDGPSGGYYTLQDHALFEGVAAESITHVGFWSGWYVWSLTYQDGAALVGDGAFDGDTGLYVVTSPDTKYPVS